METAERPAANLVFLVDTSGSMNQPVAGDSEGPARLFTALSDAGINVRVINQGASEMNIIVGVGNEHFEKAITAAYHEFIN